MLKSLFLCVCAALLLSSCAKKSETTYTDSAGVTTTPGNQPMTPPADSVHSTPPAAPAMTDANILAMLSEADSGEIAEAKLVAAKTKNAAVKGYANMMIKDHTKMKSDGEALAKKLNVTPVPPANDPQPSELASAMSMLGSTTDAWSLDSLYMNHAIEDHQKVMDRVNDLQSKAQSADLKAAMDKAKPVIQKHLDTAKDIVSKMKAPAAKK